PWTVRGVEVRGIAEALSGQTPSQPWLSPEIIRIHPQRILSRGVEPDVPGMHGRSVESPDRQPHPGAAAG
ncbi:MAG: pyridoxamine 5-phosphate oxidase family protein, partial [Pseudonocardiales bacterium]|nr:pyridoxamine 5-phosphate oxidase family protein [Pseudonocardiales bacterium]